MSNISIALMPESHQTFYIRYFKIQNMRLFQLVLLKPEGLLFLHGFNLVQPGLDSWFMVVDHLGSETNPLSFLENTTFGWYNQF